MTVRYLRAVQRQQISGSASSDPSNLNKYRSGYAECLNEVTRYLGTSTKTTEAAPEIQAQLVNHLATSMVTTSPQQTSPVQSQSSGPLPASHQQQAMQYAATIRQQQQQVRQPTSPTVAETAVTRRDTVLTNSMSPSIDGAYYRTVSPVPEGATTDFALTTPVYNNTRINSTRGASPAVAYSPRQQYHQNITVDVTGATPSGEITLVLPQQALPNGQLPTHFIPVYTQEPGHVSPAPSNESDTYTLSPTTSPRVTYADVSCHRSSSPSSVSVCSARSSPVMMTAPITHQTELYTTISRDYEYSKSSYVIDHCAPKKEPMWRPW